MSSHSAARKIGIQGFGLISALGNSAESTWRALLAGIAIQDHAKVSPPRSLNAPRVIALAQQAAAEALAQARWTAEQLQSPETALLVGTSKGPVEQWLAGDVAREGLAAVASELSVSLGMGMGPRLTLSAACSSGLHALIRAVMLLRAGEVRRALVVGCEASVHPMFISSFSRLGVLPPAGYGCRPFDRQRRGFVMSDAAAAVCLEVDSSGAIAQIEGVAMGGDATHITRGDPQGAVLRKLITRLIEGDGPIDLLHAHGTGTLSNDAVELAALDALCPAGIVYSHKGALGHSLGAAGMVSVVINCLAHRNGITPAIANLTEPMPTERVQLATTQIARPIGRSITLAAGFGGPLAAVAMRSA